MAKRKHIERSSSETASPTSAQTPLSETKSELLAIESPSISPAVETPAIVTDTPGPAIEPIAAEPLSAPEIKAADATPACPRFGFRLSARHKRHALLAASVALAAAIGTVIGAMATGGLAPPPLAETAGVHERQAMQQSIARLSEEITTLKANLAAANKSTHSQIAKIADKFTERLDQPKTPEITGSIPTPMPRPGNATLESRPPVVKDWTIRDARDGYVYVQGHGDIYQVVTGAHLPGLGPVQSIMHQDGRWAVVTPKGLIVSMRDRHYFE